MGHHSYTADSEAFVAVLSVNNWDDDKTADVRIRYKLTQRGCGRSIDSFWPMQIQRNPTNTDELVVASISCNFHTAFPNSLYVGTIAGKNPDLLAFVGDQFYELSGGVGPVFHPLEKAVLNYFHKWYLHGWTWRELTRVRPSIALPDDHDVYHGNIWGEGGARLPDGEADPSVGGYRMPAHWVNIVHRTHTAHHPTFPAGPGTGNRISSFFGELVFGEVSFAILADRMFKSGPKGRVTFGSDRGDHILDRGFDRQSIDGSGLDLLGQQQEQFLAEWVTDWEHCKMKAVISASPFASLATTHGPGRSRLVADLDSNVWPRSARNTAVDIIRKAFAVHICGDQHLPVVAQYGVEVFRDASYVFAGPAVNISYPRWWEPKVSGENRSPGSPSYTGDYLDSFGNRIMVNAVANGDTEENHNGIIERLYSHDPESPSIEDTIESEFRKKAGIGLVRFMKSRRRIEFECWSLHTDSQQFDGWPIEVPMTENHGRAAEGELASFSFAGFREPVVSLMDEQSGELIYALRINGTQFSPFVFRPGRNSVRVALPEKRLEKHYNSLGPTTTGVPEIGVELRDLVQY